MRTYAPQAKPRARIRPPSNRTASRVPGRRSGLAASVLQLQRTVGNQAARRPLSGEKRRLQRAYAVSGPVTRERQSVPTPTLELAAPRGKRRRFSGSLKVVVPAQAREADNRRRPLLLRLH